jgi:hypothetical protein
VLFPCFLKSSFGCRSPVPLGAAWQTQIDLGADQAYGAERGGWSECAVVVAAVVAVATVVALPWRAAASHDGERAARAAPADIKRSATGSWRMPCTKGHFPVLWPLVAGPHASPKMRIAGGRRARFDGQCVWRGLLVYRFGFARPAPQGKQTGDLLNCCAPAMSRR